MKITRKTNVFVKTERKIIVRGGSSKDFVCCADCAEQMLPAQTSADFFGISSREIYRFIESGKIHFVETEANEIYVCPVSVRRVLELND
jgi:hypothetical protein